MVILSTAVVFIALNGYMYYKISTQSDKDSLTADINATVTQSRNIASGISTPTDTDIQTSPYDQLMEIVITADDVKKADVEYRIGAMTPYNILYATEKEVLESIQRILGDTHDINTVEDDYKSYIVSLRRVEMSEKVREGDSKVGKVVNEYFAKIKNEPSTKEDEENEEEGKDEISEDDPFGSFEDLYQDPLLNNFNDEEEKEDGSEK